ncbi:MAG: polyprenyl diphosphate synthase [Candidatus Caldatribacteriaceae bacterium]
MGEERKGNYERLDAILKHVAIIMDGNGRWAERKGLPRIEGHKKGVEVTRCIVEESGKLGLQFLTLYSFSTENWKRPLNEVQRLMYLFQESIVRYGEELHNSQVRVRFLGRREGLPKEVVKSMSALEEKTSSNQGLTLSLAINYGGRDEILRAIQKMFQYEDALVRLDEKVFQSYLDTASCPDPDLLIRTGGEKRISNFLLWQIAYTELWFTETLWPDFTTTEFRKALEDFALRKRKFGGIH